MLGLPEFTSGVDVNVRSWPFGRLPVVPGSRDLKDGFSRLPTYKASDSAEPLRHHGAPVATELARRVHRCLQSQERVHRFRSKGRPAMPVSATSASSRGRRRLDYRAATGEPIR
ncbi:hypothetical protein A8E25_30710 [Burkholderia cenocepacia]|nr:hypothetical protein BURCENK562V_C1015 [Burkholderia cenocepacia K56-2Valvano]ERI32002.1 hypothetical protein BURCENBC7_AP7346 [Burkholderia cenocepacia BC7]ONR51389.1 hypothetical protein A8E17_31930 [Burkholderia cenocepacia]ONR67461.1 hypothetical protein A8E23_21415 [Burkholderia cenocepacia]ONR70208.1 hypothetical protein A8E22_33425 [Burkholderia cenocepacia]